MGIRKEIARVIADAQNVPFVGPKQMRVAAAVMPIVERAQAEALREAARVFAEGAWADAFMRGEVEDDVSAVQATDRWLNRRADRIENEGKTND